MEVIRIIATLKVKEAYLSELIQNFRQIVDESRKEEGNIIYDLCQDIKNPTTLNFVEIWKSEEALENHNKTTHFKDFLKYIEGKYESLDIFKMHKIY